MSSGEKMPWCAWLFLPVVLVGAILLWEVAAALMILEAEDRLRGRGGRG